MIISLTKLYPKGSKPEAKAHANTLRKLGFNARVIAFPNGYGIYAGKRSK